MKDSEEKEELFVTYAAIRKIHLNYDMEFSCREVIKL